MLLTITTTHPPATDLGFLLYKNPARAQSFALSFGQAHVFYPEANPERCTAALLLDVDPVGLVRNRRGPAGDAFALEQYVNDRPYVASSFLSVAIAQVFGTALAGRSKDRPELVATPLPLQARVAVLPCRGGEGFLRRLAGFDAAAVVEVVEHLDPWRLAAFERGLFEHARPTTVVLTAPNVEYNVRFEWLPAGRLRHRDHRFEWTREQFQEWARGVAERFSYAVRFLPVGPEDPEVGAPTQMGVFTAR